MQKTEAQQAEMTLREMNKLIRDLDIWLSSTKKKLQHANNDEEQLQVISQFAWIENVCITHGMFFSFFFFP